MATWDSPYCLSFFGRLIGRTGTDAILDATKYQMLSEAQNEVIADMAAIVPNVLYPTVATGSLPTATIDASGTIATFGTDSNGYAKFPMGHGNLFENLTDISTNPFVQYESFGTGIRSLNNQQLPATLYWYGIAQPADIDATHQPSIFPEAARALICIRAAYNFGTEGNRNTALSTSMAARYGYPLHPTQPGRFAFWCLTWKTQFAKGGALGSFTGTELALGGYVGYGAGQIVWGT